MVLRLKQCEKHMQMFNKACPVCERDEREKNTESIKWISTSDELPDAGSEVLVCFERNDVEDRDVCAAVYDDELEEPWVPEGLQPYFGVVMFWAEKPVGPKRS